MALEEKVKKESRTIPFIGAAAGAALGAYQTYSVLDRGYMAYAGAAVGGLAGAAVGYFAGWAGQKLVKTVFGGMKDLGQKVTESKPKAPKEKAA